MKNKSARRSQRLRTIRRRPPPKGDTSECRKGKSKHREAAVGVFDWDDGAYVLFEERARVVQVHGILGPRLLGVSDDGDWTGRG